MRRVNLVKYLQIRNFLNKENIELTCSASLFKTNQATKHIPYFHTRLLSKIYQFLDHLLMEINIKFKKLVAKLHFFIKMKEHLK